MKRCRRYIKGSQFHQRTESIKKETNGNFRTKYTESEIKNPLHGLDETQQSLRGDRISDLKDRSTKV